MYWQDARVYPTLALRTAALLFGKTRLRRVIAGQATKAQPESDVVMFNLSTALLRGMGASEGEAGATPDPVDPAHQADALVGHLQLLLIQ